MTATISNTTTTELPIDFQGAVDTVVEWGGWAFNSAADLVKTGADKVVTAVKAAFAAVLPMLQNAWAKVSPYVTSPMGVGIACTAATVWLASSAWNGDNPVQRVAYAAAAVVAASFAFTAFANPAALMA